MSFFKLTDRVASLVNCTAQRVDRASGNSKLDALLLPEGKHAVHDEYNADAHTNDNADYFTSDAVLFGLGLGIYWTVGINWF